MQSCSLDSPGGLNTFALRRVPRWGLEEGVKESNMRISFHCVFPPPFNPFFGIQVNTSKGVKNGCVEGNLEMP